MQDPEDGINAEEMDPAVPSELLELHVELEVAGKTPEEFKRYVDGERGTE